MAGAAPRGLNRPSTAGLTGFSAAAPGDRDSWSLIQILGGRNRTWKWAAILHVEVWFCFTMCTLYSTFRSVIELLLSPHGDDICLQGVWPLSWPLGRIRRLRGLLWGVPGDFSSWKGLCDPTTHFQWDKPPMGSPKVSQGWLQSLPTPPGSSLAHSPGSPAFPIGVGPGSLPGDPVSRV